MPSISAIPKIPNKIKSADIINVTKRRVILVSKLLRLVLSNTMATRPILDKNPNSNLALVSSVSLQKIKQLSDIKSRIINIIIEPQEKKLIIRSNNFLLTPSV